MVHGRVWRDVELPPTRLAPERAFDAFLGLEWIELSDESAVVTFAARDELKQAFGLLHGGIYSAVAESVASLATIRVVWRDGLMAQGLSNCASFIRPVTDGIVRVTAARRGHDEREWLWGHQFHDEAGRLCALVDVTIAVRALPTAARESA